MTKKTLLFLLMLVGMITLTACKPDEVVDPTCTKDQKLVDHVCVDNENTDPDPDPDPDPEPDPEPLFDYGVINGDFEFNMQEWHYYTADGFHDISTSEFRSDGKSLSVENGATNYTSIWQTINVDKVDNPQTGDFVQFEAYFKAPATVTGTVKIYVENVIDENTKVIIAESSSTILDTTEWVKVMTEVGEIPAGATDLNLVMIFETTGVVHVDDVALTSTISNNARASYINLDTVALDGFQNDITEYTVYLPSSVVPTLSSASVNSTSTLVVNQSTAIGSPATVVVTAEDGTVVTYTVNFVEAGLTDLMYIKLDGETVVGFDADKTDYYVLLDNDTVPVITFDTFYAGTTVVASSLVDVPNEVTLTVTNGTETKVYTIDFDVKSADMFYVPNNDFEATFDWQTWTGTTNVPMVSNAFAHSGIYSLVTYHQSSVWKEFAFEAGLPAIDDAVSVGAWVYIDSDTPDYNFVVKLVGYTESTSSKVTFSEYQIASGIALNEWVYIEGSFADILTCDRIQVVIENNSNVDVYVDDITITKGVSSNAYLTDLTVDATSVTGFDKEVMEYSFITDGVTIPVIAAFAQNGDASVLVTQATTADGDASVSVTAFDGTIKTYTVHFTVPSSGQLSDLTVGGVSLDGFDSLKNEYYIVLPSTTTVFPTIDGVLIDETDSKVVSSGTLPGYVTVTITTTDSVVNTYTVYAEVENADALSTPYPDVNFDKALENWGVSSATDVFQSSEQFLNGSKALKMITGEAWVGFDLAGGDYPSKGSAYSVGLWLYVEGTTQTGFNIRLLEKDNNVELINESMTVTENGKWVYVETAVSAGVSDLAGYLQIVITNGTGEVVYVDGIRFIEHEAVVVDPPVGDTVYGITSANLDFEASDVWGFWSPTGSGVSYDTTTKRDTQSLMMSEGSAWAGFGFDGPAYPVKGDTVKLGFWIYVDSSTATSVGGFTIKLVEKEGTLTADNAAIVYTTQHVSFDMDTWVYLETTTATISDAPAYLQIVMEEGTDGTVFVDDITVIKINE